MRNKRINEAKKLLKNLRESISKRRSPFIGMREEEVIESLRNIRAQLWEEKLAARS